MTRKPTNLIVSRTLLTFGEPMDNGWTFAKKTIINSLKKAKRDGFIPVIHQKMVNEQTGAIDRKSAAALLKDFNIEGNKLMVLVYCLNKEMAKTIKGLKLVPFGYGLVDEDAVIQSFKLTALIIQDPQMPSVQPLLDDI